jgi:hypothetical protein
VAIFLAIYFGLRFTLLVGAGLYMGALFVVWLKSNAYEHSEQPVVAHVG